MVDYNPSNPNIAGVEWPASDRNAYPLISTSGRTAIIDAATTETVDRVKLFLRTVVGQTTVVHQGQPIDPQAAQYSVDIYDTSDMHPGAVNRAYSRPVEAPTSTVPWFRGDGGPSNTNLWNLIDDGYPYVIPAPGVDTDAILAGYPQTGSNHPGRAHLRLRASPTFRDFNNTVVTVANKRIVDIKSVVIAFSYNGNPNSVNVFVSNGVDGEMHIPLVGTTGTSPVLVNNSVAQGFHFSMAGTSRHWRNYQTLIWPDVEEMLSGGTGNWGVAINGISRSGGFGAGIHQTWLGVDYCDEKRLATGTATVTVDTTVLGNWVEFELVDPLTNAPTTWNKQAGKTYLVVCRASPRNGSGNGWIGLDTSNTVVPDSGPIPGLEGHPSSANWPFIPAAPPGNIVGHANAAVMLPSSVVTVPTETVSQSYYFQNGGTVRADSQPYTDSAELPVSDGGFVEQEMSNTAAAPYGIVQVLIRNTTDVHTANHPLAVELRRRSDSALLASESITEAQFPPVADNLWYQIRLRLNVGPTLTPGVQYYVRLVSAATTGAYPLRILTTTDATAAAASFGGTTDCATASVFGEVAFWDAIVAIVQIPPQITGLNTTVGTFDSDRFMLGQCVVPTVSFAQLSWVGSGLGSTFSRYEIERNDDGATWQQIAVMPTVADTLFADFESRRNIQGQWRIRQVRDDEAASDWASFAPTIIPGGEFEVVLANNDAPEQTLGLLDEPGHHYERLSGDRRVEHALYGRDNMLAFRESEDRGDRFGRRFVLAFDDPTPKIFPFTGGRALFDPLVVLLENPALPHVALLDWRGRRWYTAPTIEDLNHEEPAGRYHADIEFLEVAGPTPASRSYGSFVGPTEGAYPGGYEEGY